MIVRLSSEATHTSYAQTSQITNHLSGQGRKGETLLPVFSAAAEPGASLESVRSLDSFSMLSSALFRQSLIVTALRAKNDNLARDITEINPSVPPPANKGVFTMKGSRLVDDESIPAGVYNALIKHGWASPSHRVMQIALSSPNGADGVALLDTLSTKSFSLRSNPLYEKSIPQLALGISQLEVLQYIWRTFDVSPTPESLVQAVEFRDEGGVNVMRWLVDEHGLDVNYVLIPAADYGSIPKTDPRDRAEREHADKLHARSRKKTALHAAAFKGNSDAVSFLLERGADLDIQDGSGRTALAIAIGEGHNDVVQVLKRHKP